MQRSITFRLRPDMAREHIAKATRLGVQKIAMQALRGIVMRTPVDTGRARSNWQVSLDSPLLTNKDAYSPGTKLGIGESGNAESAIQVGAATIGSAPAFGVIYIANGLPYINRLENGWSGQAPAGMVRLTLDQIAAQFR